MSARAGQGERWEDAARGQRRGTVLLRSNQVFSKAQFYSMTKPKLTQMLCKEEIQNNAFLARG